MDMTFFTPRLSGTVKAISSKSEAHRQLICAALADSPTKIICSDTNDDIDATVRCLCALGADIVRLSDGFSVKPITNPPECATLDCGESGSTLRFLIPVIAALGVNAKIYMHGRLPSRPLSPLYELLENVGITMSAQGENPFCIKGKLRCGDYNISANVSSQFISGMLFALSLAQGNSTLTLMGNIESENYIDMTLDAITKFGGDITRQDNTFKIKSVGKFTSPDTVTVGGDWSNAAFFLCAGAIGEQPVTVNGLDMNSAQGDRKILDVLRKMGANVTISGINITVSKNELSGISLDASQIPDLVPIIATVASVCRGKTIICNAGRLKIKESNRIESTCKMLSDLGASITPTNDGMIIEGVNTLCGGITDSARDHRIAMSAAIASTAATSPVTVTNFEAVNKSYPKFYCDFKTLNHGEV